jgi:hypothetical protein
MSNCVVSISGTTINPANMTGLSTNPTTWAYPIVSTAAPLPIQNLQIAEGSTLYDPTTWVPQCDLDVGLNEFPSLPLVRGSDSLDVLRSVIGSEYGVAGFNESGRFFFKNRQTARRGLLSSVKNWTGDRGLTQLAVGSAPGSVRNSIPVKTSSTYRTNTYTTVWSTKAIDDFFTYPGTNLYKITLDNPCQLNDFSDMTFVSMATWDTPPTSETSHRFHCVDNAFTAVTTATVRVWLDPVALAAGRDECFVQVVNPTLGPIRFATTDGRPAFLVGGQPAIETAEVVQTYERASSIAKYGRQVLPLDNDPWRQSQTFIAPFTLSLLKDLKLPVPVFDTITVVGDPRLQLLDVGLLADAGGIADPTTVSVEQLTRRLSGGKLEDALVVRSFGAPGRWILGHPQYSFLGITTKLG